MTPTPPPPQQASANGLAVAYTQPSLDSQSAANTQASPSDIATYAQTPTKPQPRIPQSAPPKTRTQQLLTSPAAAQRSKASLEAFRVARTLKEGFLRLKARADPSMLSPTRRAQRTLSANALPSSSLSQRGLLERHHSELPRYGSFDAPESPRARPVALHPAYSCPQRRGRETLNPAYSCPQRRVRESHASRKPAPRFSLAGAEVAEAAEAMILFMKSEPSSQNEPSPSTSISPRLSNQSRALVRASSAETETDTESILISDTEGNDRLSERTTPLVDSDHIDHIPPPPPLGVAKRTHADSETLGFRQSPQKRPCL
ncbi:hypothetical protein GGF43_001986 [Coemansia sp. RSA 2618]|nr:hypothetical protein GGF43_001986 [Coemansia sp. RSA 2618]